MFYVKVNGYQSGQDRGCYRPETTPEAAIKAAVLATDYSCITGTVSGPDTVKITEPTFQPGILGGKGGYVLHYSVFRAGKQIGPSREVWVHTPREI